jgi:hypothetical protein
VAEQDGVVAEHQGVAFEVGQLANEFDGRLVQFRPAQPLVDAAAGDKDGVLVKWVQVRFGEFVINHRARIAAHRFDVFDVRVNRERVFIVTAAGIVEPAFRSFFINAGAVEKRASA